MNRSRAVRLYVLVFVLVGPFTSAWADEMVESAIAKVRQSISEIGVIESIQDNSDLIRMWRQIDAISAMAYLADTAPDAFNRSGSGAFRKVDMHKRIDSHFRARPVVGNDDEAAELLSSIIRLHASIVKDRLDGRVSQRVYGEVAAFAKSNGRIVARELAANIGAPDLVPTERNPFE